MEPFVAIMALGVKVFASCDNRHYYKKKDLDMKKLNYLVVLALMLGGCSYKNDPIALESYKANYNGEMAQKNVSVFLSTVKDTRVDKRTVGYVLENSKKTVALYSEDNFEQKYKDGLGYALNIAGFNTNVTEEEATIVVKVFIKDIKILYTNESFEENLKGTLSVQAGVKKDNQIITFDFKQSSGKWIAPSHNSKDVAPFLHSLFTDSINQVITKLTTLKEKE